MKKWFAYAALAILGAGATSFILHGPNKPVQAATDSISFDKRIAPFTLTSPNGSSMLIGQWDGHKATVLMFVASQCRVSNQYNARLRKLIQTYSPKGIRFVGIDYDYGLPDDPDHPKKQDFGFPVLRDPHNKIADQFHAQVTPEIFVIGSSGGLLYHGRIDNSQVESEVKTKSLQNALDSILTGQPIAEKETRAFGCSIVRID